MLEKLKKEIREICTYYEYDGITKNYFIDEQRFADIFALVDKAHQEGKEEEKQFCQNKIDSISTKKPDRESNEYDLGREDFKKEIKILIK